MGAVRLPLGEDTSLIPHPPLFAVSTERNETAVFAAENLDESFHTVDFRIDGPLAGGGSTGIPPREWRSLSLKLRQDPAANLSGGARADTAGPDGLLREQMTVSSGTEHSQTPVYFAVVPEKGTIGYRFDFDLDGNPEWVLENAGLRLIFSPEAGGRAIALVDKSSAVNLATTIGLLADHFAYTPNPPGINPARAHGRYGMFNRRYRAEWLNEDDGRALRLSYRAPDVTPAGARIEKTIRLLDAHRFAVDYDVVLDAAAPADAANPFAAPLPQGIRQAFVAVNSVLAHSGGAQSTRFCWSAAPRAADGSEPPPERCETFAPGGDTLNLPPTVERIEVRTLGKPSLVIGWKNARMTVEMKNYSALLRLEFHPLQPGGGPTHPRVEFTVQNNE